MLEDGRKTALYIRISDEDSNVDGKMKLESNSISAQRMLLMEYTEKILHVNKDRMLEYSDDGISGTHFNRDGFKKMMEDAKAGGIGCIIVKDFSRFGRDYLEVGYYLEYIFPLLDIRFISVNDRYDSFESKGMTGGMNVALKNLINTMYSQDLSKKMMSALEVRTKNGTRLPTCAAYGYKKGADGKIIVDQEEAVVVKRIFSLALAGKSNSDIARTLNEEGIPTRTQKKLVRNNKENLSTDSSDIKTFWTLTTIKRILGDEVYTGVQIWGKRHCNMHTNHHVVYADENEWVRIENAHEAIISKKLFEQVRAIRPERKVICRKTSSSVQNTSTLFVCGYCGHKMQQENRRKKMLACPGCRISGNENCRNMRLEQESIEETAVAYVKHFGEVMLRKDAEVSRKNHDIFPNNQHEYNYEVRRETLASKKIKLYDDYKNGFLDRESYKAEAKKLTVQLEQLKIEAEKCNQHQDNASDDEKLEMQRAEWKAVSTLERFDNGLLSKVIQKIRIFGQNDIEIEWKSDDPLQVKARG